MIRPKTFACAVALAAALALTSLGLARPARAGVRDFRQTNNSSYAIIRMDIVPSDMDDGVWDDTTQLTLQRPIFPGETFDFTIDDSYAPGECVFDIRVVDSDGNSGVAQGIDLCTGDVTMTYNNAQ